MWECNCRSATVLESAGALLSQEAGPKKRSRAKLDLLRSPPLPHPPPPHRSLTTVKLQTRVCIYIIAVCCVQITSTSSATLPRIRLSLPPCAGFLINSSWPSFLAVTLFYACDCFVFERDLPALLCRLLLGYLLHRVLKVTYATHRATKWS